MASSRLSSAAITSRSWSERSSPSQQQRSARVSCAKECPPTRAKPKRALRQPRTHKCFAAARLATPRAVVLVEGVSDKVALETLASRRGRELVRGGVSVVPIGGAPAIGRVLRDYRAGGVDGGGGAGGWGAGGGGPGPARAARRRLGRADLERLGFFVCEADLEDELVRSLGVPAVEQVLAAHRKLGSFRTYQKQPAHRARSTDQQLRGFLNNWKIRLAAPLGEALELSRVPRPLDGVLAHLED